MPLFRRALAATAEETAASTAASMASAAAAAMGGGASHDDVLSILARLAEEVQLPALTRALRLRLAEGVANPSVVVRTFLYDRGRRELVHHTFDEHGEIALETRSPETRGCLGACLRVAPILAAVNAPTPPPAHHHPIHTPGGKLRSSS